MSVAERVKSLIDKNNMTQKKFASKLDISPARLNNYLSGIAKFPNDLLIIVAKELSVDLSWLLTGEGDPHPRARDTIISKSPMVQIQIVAEVCAGDGLEAIESEDPELIAVPANMLPLPGPYWAFRVVGNSMLPELRPGDVVIVTKNWYDLDYNNKVCVFRTGDGLMIKSVYIAPKAKFGLLIPYNSTYPVLKYDKNDKDLELLGILVTLIRHYN